MDQKISLEEALRFLERCSHCTGCKRCEYHDWAVKVICAQLREMLD